MTVAEQLWIAGVLMAFGIFGVKVGLGLGALLFSQQVTTSRKIICLSGTLSTYLVLFGGMFFLITHFRLLNYLDRFMRLLQYGMWTHLAVALGLFLWGARLILKGPSQSSRHSHRAGLLLLLPCPVCATVVLLNLSMAYTMFSFSPLETTLILFAIFTLIVLMVLGLVFPFRKKVALETSFLGTAMVFIALYFLITVTISPLYPEIRAAFHMACSNTAVKPADMEDTALFFVIFLTLAGMGFVRNYFFKGVKR